MFLKEIVFGIIGGLGLFVYGIHLMGEGLHKLAGTGIRRILRSLTSKPLMAMVVGAIITALIQSSSATTVLAVGFVNAGLMTLNQTIGVILGANIGTTITAQIIAFKLTDYALPILGIGYALNFFCKEKSWKNIGEFLLGFGMLFLGLSIMTSVVKPMSGNPVIRGLFIKYDNNILLAMLTGIVVTAILQSSSATTGIVLALAASNLITLNGAIPMILGCNIGTCITALLASIGTSINAKRTAWAHVFFNVIGSALFLIFLRPFRFIVLHSSTDLVRQCANAHTFFNVIGSFLFLPLTNLYATFIRGVITGKEDVEIDHIPTYLENHLLNTPEVAVDAATKEIIRTLDLTRIMIASSMQGFFENDPKHLQKVETQEEAVDARRLKITDYLVELMQRQLSEEVSKKIPAMIHVINDVERIGDHAMNLKKLAQQENDLKLCFSQKAMEETRAAYKELIDMLDVTLDALRDNDIEKAALVLKKEKNINRMRDEYKANHINRLEQGDCNVLAGVVFIDLLANFEKIGDHLTNVGQAIMDSLQWSRQ
ncbi:Na/Pi cotransporter family protein [bacterium]|nr:Na/Pi cotransporter family protein [bacterium]